MKTKRKRIGRWNDLVTRQVIYQTNDGIEVDEIDHFEVQRKRVFYEDVVLVTRHHYMGPGFIAVMLLVGLGFIAIGVATRVTGAIITFAIIGAPFVIAGILRVALGVEVITVFGKRSRARIRYVYRKAFARQIFAEIVARSRDAQRRLAEEIRESEPPPAPPLSDEVPMPPAEP